MDNPPTWRVRLGAVGWEHQSWSATFYPPELPAEWRLAFYNQCFTCVLIPYRRWSGAVETEIARWRDDTLERFRFILEAGPSPLTGAERARAAALGPRLGMVYRSSSPAPGARLLWLDPAESLKALAARLPADASSPGECFLICRAPDTGYLQQVGTLLELLHI